MLEDAGSVVPIPSTGGRSYCAAGTSVLHQVTKALLQNVHQGNLRFVSSLALQKLNDDAAELCGLLQVHQVADAADHHPPRPGYSGLDRASMGVNVGNVG